MEVPPGRCSRAVSNTGEILLVEVIGTWKVRVRVNNDIAVRVSFLLEQPGEDVRGVVRVLDATFGSETKVQTGAIRKGPDPVVSQLLVADKRTLILAEEETIS